MAALAALALFLPACDSDGGGDGPADTTATFEATVTGDDGFEFDGVPLAFSYALVDPQTPEDTLARATQIYLTGLGDEARPGIVFRLGEEPTVGTVALGTRLASLDGASASLSVVDGDVYLLAESASGSLAISRADDAVIEGTFSFVTESAAELPSSGGTFPLPGDGGIETRPYRVTVEGRFEADLQASPPGGPRPFPSVPYPVP